MAKWNTEWKVLSHGEIVELDDNLWWVQGSLPGMSLKRVMTIVKLNDGRLVIHNAIALNEEGMQRLEGWGSPAYLIVPNGAHRLDALVYKQRYPALTVVAPKGARTQVEEAVRVDMTYEEFPHDETVRLEMLQGVKETEGAMLVHSAGGTSVVLNDAVFNMDRKRDPLGFFFTTLLGSAPGPRVSRLAKLMFVKDKGALRSDLERLAAIPDLARLIVSHEKVASGPAAAEALTRAATYL